MQSQLGQIVEILMYGYIMELTLISHNVQYNNYLFSSLGTHILLIYRELPTWVFYKVTDCAREITIYLVTENINYV